MTAVAAVVVGLLVLLLGALSCGWPGYGGAPGLCGTVAWPVRVRLVLERATRPACGGSAAG